MECVLGGFLFDIRYHGTEKQEKLKKKDNGKTKLPYRILLMCFFELRNSDSFDSKFGLRNYIKHTKGLFYQLYFKNQAESGPKSH